MNSRLSIFLAAVLLLSAGLSVQGQQTSPSIDEQIKQKEDELRRLKEIKQRLEQIKQLQGEIDALQAGRDVSSAPPAAQPTPVTETGAMTATPRSNPPAPTPAPTPVVMSRGAGSAAPLVKTNITGKTGTGTDAMSVRSCAEILNLRPEQTSLLEKYFCNSVEEIKREKERDSTGQLAGIFPRRDFQTLMVFLLAREGRAQYVLAAEEERTDKQVGADASSSGSTSLVTKGSVPAVLGLAVDSGALLRTNSGSALTFRGNFAGLAKALAGKGFISGYDEDSPAMRFFRRASFAVTYDPTRGNQTPIFTGSSQQISSYSFHLDLYNKRDPRLPRYKRDWTEFLSNESGDFALQIQTSLTALTDEGMDSFVDPELQAWFSGMDRAVRNAAPGEVEAVLKEWLAKAPHDFSEATVAEMRSFERRFRAWLDKREDILDKIARAPIFSFDYVNDRPAGAPSVSRFNFIAEKGLGGRFDFTFNGALSIFNERPVDGYNRIRDFQFALQLDAPLGEIGLGLGKPVLSFAGRYERLMNDEIISGLRLTDTRGDIGIGQLKLLIPIKKSGIKIPLSISFANRTELLNEKEVRGNFGFTFDLDTLYTLFKPF